MLGENGIRRGERTKKVPKYMQYDDADYNIFPTAKTVEQKEKQPTSAENAQIARLFQKFISSINQKMRDYDQKQQADRLLESLQNEGQKESNKGHTLLSLENAAQKPAGGALGGSKRTRELGQQKAVKSEGKKAGGVSTVKSAVTSSLQLDQDYNGMLNQHIRNSYPNASSDTLGGTDGQKQQTHQQTSKSRGKESKQEKKGNAGGKNGKGKEGKVEELKPFKRQSYHIAIAYHIHLIKVKARIPPVLDMDPTAPSRRLRDAQTKQ